ncbi:hypothetical protein [Lentzea xinjiangensis]|uniref:hypothetical protein n=1 Tax=Lentzea xinjiangensis TaxID=402600 RepID=UPI0011609CBF|nr:hypothetical protein [Lentzea xinjiangensis]
MSTSMAFGSVCRVPEDCPIVNRTPGGSGCRRRGAGDRRPPGAPEVEAGESSDEAVRDDPALAHQDVLGNG